LRISAPLIRLHQALCLYAAFTGNAYSFQTGLPETLGLPARKGWAFEQPVIDLSAGGQLSGHQPGSAVFVIAFVELFNCEDFITGTKSCQMMILLILTTGTIALDKLTLN